MGDASLVVCVGRLYVDIVLTGLPRLPRLGREDYATGVAATTGGGAFITAAHLLALKRSAALASALGDDPLSQTLTSQIIATGLSLDHLERFPGGPQLTVSLAVDDDRAFATCRAGPAAPSALRDILATGGVRHVHVAELATALEAPWLIASARRAGASVSLDVAWDDAALSHREALAVGRSVDLLLPNEDEAAALSGRDPSNIPALIDALSREGALVAVKCGARGAFAGRGGDMWRASAPKADVIDATGAGDAFAAGFLDAWLDRSSIDECLRRGVACGVHAVAQIGGARVLPERNAILRDSKAIQVSRVELTRAN